MAEKSSELDNINEPDAVSTMQGANQDLYLQPRDRDFSDLATTDVSDNDDDATADTEQIRSRIEETRSQMSETIDAIQEKLSISNISEQVKEQVSEQITSAYETAKDSVYGATVGKVGEFMKKAGRELSKTEAGRVAKDNPFPMILIGLGVGLLAYQSAYGKKRKTYSYEYYDNDYDNEGYDDNRRYSQRSAFGSAQNTISDTASSAYGSAADAAGSAYDSVSGAANSAYEGVTDAASSAYSGVTSAASNAYSSVADAAEKTYEKVGDFGSQAREQYDYYIDENPLAVGAVALAVGAAVGLSLPSTRYEGQLMGEARDNLMSRAQEAAGDLVDRVKQVAGEAQKTLGDEVRSVVDETKKTVTQEAEKQGLTSAATTGAGDKNDKKSSGTGDKTQNTGTKI